MMERIHAPVLAMDDLLPVVGEAGAGTTRLGEEIGRERETRGLAKKMKRERGTITLIFPPLFPFKAGQAEPLRSARHVGREQAALTADDPASQRLPQKIQFVEAEATCL